MCVCMCVSERMCVSAFVGVSVYECRSLIVTLRVRVCVLLFV